VGEKWLLVVEGPNSMRHVQLGMHGMTRNIFSDIEDKISLWWKDVLKDRRWPGGKRTCCETGGFG
jgi:hypothetical protein